jgi:aromatic-L-amino-acid decarboxylase
MLAMGEAALHKVVEHIASLPQQQRSDLNDRLEVVRALREPLPEHGTPFEELMDFVMKRVIPKSINTAHPAYLGYIPGGGLYPSAVAEFIAAATNRYAGAWFGAPAAARLENNVVEWFAQMMGYPATTRGILTSGGSLANFSAVVTARRHLLGDDLARGTMYMSTQTHHCVIKAAILAGLPEKNVRLIEPDENYRVRPEAVEKAVRDDFAKGLKPFLIVGNAGTTNTGAVDPLPALAEICRQHQLWFHVDGAYGAFFRLCEEGKRRLIGIEGSDSLVLDPHKGLFLPYGVGCLLVKEGELLRKAHMVSADYLQDHSTPEGEVNAAEHSPELSRPFRGLQVWLPLRLYGVKAFAENLSEKLRLTKYLHEKFLAEPNFECMSAPELSVITFRYRPVRGDINDFNKKLLAKLVESGKLFLSSTILRGRFIIRVCILSFRTHQHEVDEAFAIIKEMASALEKNQR